jgi:ribokinase
MVGAVGEDAYADMTLGNFEEQGVDVARVLRAPGSSGVAPIWVERDGTNRIIVVAGANDLVSPGEAAAAVRSMDSAEVVVGQLEIPQAVTLEAFRAARARGATTILNPAPASELRSELLDLTDWLIPNEPELEVLAGIRAGDDDQLLRFATEVRAGLVVTLGAAGVAIVQGGSIERLAAPAVEAVDTTGAGDAFVGAFAAGLALGLVPSAAARLGVACASESVRQPGTQASFPSRRRVAELRAWVAAGGA